jgi:hypothetical protein
MYSYTFSVIHLTSQSEAEVPIGEVTRKSENADEGG